MNEHPATVQGRVRPGRGWAAIQPAGFYAAPPAVTTHSNDLVVAFHGEDRSGVYSFGTLPCAGLHADLAAAFAARTGPTGIRRTKASADASWEALGRFLRFLAGLRRPPRDLAALRRAHLERFRLHRVQTVDELQAAKDLLEIHYLLRAVDPSKLAGEVAEFIHQRLAMVGPRKSTGRPGYSDREFTAIMTAARSDVAAIRDRLRAGERLLARHAADPAALTAADRELAETLAGMATTGKIPTRHRRLPSGGWAHDHRARVNLARHLFLTEADLVPLLVLMVGLSGRNGETIKELPAEHRLLEGRAVAVNLVKRRRGKTRSRETVHWETGATGSRQLHTPGGCYLLLDELTRRGRRWSGASRVWSIWVPEATRGTTRTLKERTGGHIDPYAVRLGRRLSPSLSQWAVRHGLCADAGGDTDGRLPLELHLGRLRTTVEVRTAKAVGGHLPSSARTNTLDVSFLHYLRGDPRIQDWAEQILTAAVDDAERSAHNFHLRVLDAAAEHAAARSPEEAAAALGTTPQQLRRAAAGELDTLASSCLDIQRHPQTGGPCHESFLTCLRCANALVAERHLPMLYALLDLLQAELDRLRVEDWCAKHGVTWLLITRLILPRFTQAQRDAARTARPATLPAVVDLLDGPTEQP